MGRFLMRFSTFVLLTGLIMLFGSCRKDFDYAPSTAQLQFSKDTVFLDTIFTNIGSATYTLKVYNRSDKNIRIPFVGLETGAQSSYRLNVDGQAGKTFDNVPLLANDSLFVFIETTFDVSQTPENEFLYTESLLFGNGNEQQKVELVTLVKDAIFLYPSTLSDGTTESLVLGMDENGVEIRVEGFFLEEDELNFTNEKPYVIYGYAAVSEGDVLTIDAGARVHFHNDSGLLVNFGGSLQVNGSLSEDDERMENEVIFEGDRLETAYSDVPGQWGTVWLQAGSINNQITHLTLKNATIGLRADGDGLLSNPSLRLKNSQIHNSLEHNFWAKSTYVVAENTVLGSAGGSSFYGNNGGNYQFTHCTLANYWVNGIRIWPTLTLDNLSDGTSTTPFQANFVNCIIDGNSNLELLLQSDANADFDFTFDHCLIKFNDSDNQFEGNPLYDFTDASLYQNVLLNLDADFENPVQNQFQIGENSAALNVANPDISPPLPLDIWGNERGQNPDIGAYEYTVKN